MKRASILLLFLPLFNCSVETKKPIDQAEETQLKADTAALASVQEEQKQSIRKPSVEYIFPTLAKSISPYPVEGEDTLVARIGDYSYSITPTGKIREENINGKSVKTFKLKTKDWLESAYLHLFGDRLLVYYTDTDGEGATSFAELINRETGKTIYSTHIEGFNLGRPIIAGDKSYVSAIGFVGKIDLPTGKFDWKHDDLYDRQRYSFNSFDSVFVGRDTVEFISYNYRSKATDIIQVSDKSGKLVNVIK